MLKRWFARWRKGEGPKPKPSSIELYGLDNLDDDVIGYPPSPKGIPVVQPNVLLERMQVEIHFIKNELGMKPMEFDELIKPVMTAFIRYADLLPASEYKHHSTGGGLIYHSFDVAKRAMRSAQCTQFPVGLGTITDTQQSNIQWRTATVLAALLHDGGKILADVIVSNGMDGDDRIVWDAHGESTIHDWAAQHKIERYYISWRNQRHQKHQNASLMVMQRLIPQKTWSWLEKCYDGKDIHTAMLNAVAKAGIEHPMTKIVAKSDSESTKKDMFHRSSHITKEVKKVPLSEMMCDLMRHYILSGQWEVNRKNAPVWYVEDKLYIVWDNVVPTLVEEMHSAGYLIPAVPEILARSMIEEGMALDNGSELYFSICPEILGDPKNPAVIKCLKIRNPQRLVFDESKLYSIKEHPKKAAKPASPEKENKAAKDAEPVQPTAPVAHKPVKRFESSLDTVNRILGLMKSKSSKAPVVPVVDEAPDEVLDEPEQDTVEPEQSAWGDDQEHEEPALTESVQTEPQPDLPEPSLPIETCQFTQFIQAEYDYPNINGKLQIPMSDRLMIIERFIDAKPDIDALTVTKELTNAKGVAFV